MDQIGAGVTGTGNIARGHLSASQKKSHVGIYALCDLNAGLLKQRAAEYGVEETLPERRIARMPLRACRAQRPGDACHEMRILNPPLQAMKRL